MTDRVGAGYWAGFLAFGAGMLAFFHVGPSGRTAPGRDGALRRPGVRASRVGILLAPIASAVVGSAYAGLLWYRGESS